MRLFITGGVLLLAILSSTNGVKAFPSSNSVGYDGYQVLRITIENQAHLSIITRLSTSSYPSIDYWNEPEIGKFADIMVSPSDSESLTKFLQNAGIAWTVRIPDVGRLIAKQANIAVLKGNGNAADEFWLEYQPLDKIFDWMESLATANPSFITTQTIGFSYESRPIRLLRVAKPAGDTPRPAVFLDSGIHAREWISPATLTFVVDRLLNDESYADIIDGVDLHIVPVLNPDGYDYTHTTDRMWRKNRRPNAGTECFGTDLNRNFPFQWCTTGASNDSCSNNYCGSGPGSEPETIAITEYVSTPEFNWWGFVTLHSHGQEWCIPWAYTETHAPDYDEMMAIGRKAVDALEATHGMGYTLKIPSGRYGGFSMDWAKGVRGIKYPVLIELRDTGEYGFLLPPDQIIPSGEEILAAISAYLREIIAQAQELKN